MLNVGDTAIGGAVERIAELRGAGKHVTVLTNGAGRTPTEALAKYRALGFDFRLDEVVSSREVASSRLHQVLATGPWAAISRAGDGFSDIDAEVVDVIDAPEAFELAAGFLFLSSGRWTPALQARLVAALRSNPRPLVVANPDLVAPLELSLSLQPGSYGHDIADELDLPVVFHGKPFAEALADAHARLGGLPAHRVAMVGDTLHTDVLGGRAAGMGTVLVGGHGLFAGRDVLPYVERSAIVPDFVVETT